MTISKVIKFMSLFVSKTAASVDLVSALWMPLLAPSILLSLMMTHIAHVC